MKKRGLVIQRDLKPEYDVELGAEVLVARSRGMTRAGAEAALEAHARAPNATPCALAPSETPAYMAPEQLEASVSSLAKRAVDALRDAGVLGSDNSHSRPRASSPATPAITSDLEIVGAREGKTDAGHIEAEQVQPAIVGHVGADEATEARRRRLGAFARALAETPPSPLVQARTGKP